MSELDTTNPVQLRLGGSYIGKDRRGNMQIREIIAMMDSGIGCLVKYRAESPGHRLSACTAKHFQRWAERSIYTHDGYDAA